jgi:hypothetical protein
VSGLTRYCSRHYFQVIGTSLPTTFTGLARLLAIAGTRDVPAAVTSLKKELSGLGVGHYRPRQADISPIPTSLRVANHGRDLLVPTCDLTDIDIPGGCNLAIVDDHLGAAIPVDAILGHDPSINEDTDFLVS